MTSATAAALAASPAPIAEKRNIIAVASGKGGVGKTWFSITLAHALANAGAKALLFDGDLGLANVDVQLGTTPRRDLASVIAGEATLAQAATPHAVRLRHHRRPLRLGRARQPAAWPAHGAARRPRQIRAEL